jgi:hypothetical protein
MAMAAAAPAFFLDVSHLAAGGHFAVPPDDAAAGESGEAEKSHETHGRPRSFIAPKESKLCTVELSSVRADRFGAWFMGGECDFVYRTDDGVIALSPFVWIIRPSYWISRIDHER